MKDWLKPIAWATWFAFGLSLVKRRKRFFSYPPFSTSRVMVCRNWWCSNFTIGYPSLPCLKHGLMVEDTELRRKFRVVKHKLRRFYE